jgi:hypothetical protein
MIVTAPTKPPILGQGSHYKSPESTNRHYIGWMQGPGFVLSLFFVVQQLRFIR